MRLWLSAAMCRSKHVEESRNIGIINSTTRSHLVVYFYTICIMIQGTMNINPLNAELNPICYLLALLAHHFLHVSRIRVK